MTRRSGRRRRLSNSAGVVTLAVLVVVLVGLSSGCGVNVGVTQQVEVNEPLGSAAVTDVTLSMGAGTLTVGPGAAGLASGTIRYNVEPWKPVITRTDASLTIKQGSQKGVSGLGTDITNDWNLELGKAPIRLKATAGAYKGTYDFSGLTLLSLSIKDGAARGQVLWNEANPGQMDKFTYETGASTVSLIGLAYANFKSMSFKGGAGSYSLDFGGRLRTSADVSVETGAGTVKLIVPAATAARVTVGGTVNDVNIEGGWTKSTDGKTYSTAAQTTSPDKSLTINVKVSVGVLTLVTE
jgi:hypothetical protein